MDVYLVPIGRERYELYCEAPADEGLPRVEASAGIVKRLQEMFRAVLAAVEREQDALRGSRPEHAGLFSRLRRRGLKWLSERVAEQRLLWRLRGQTRVRAVHPAQLDGARALAIVRARLQSDGDRHRRWMVIDGLGMLASLVFVPLPGPNLLGYYFTFRVVGHFLAVRGAGQGLRAVAWDLQPSEALGELSGLEELPLSERTSRVSAIQARLGLSRLARFFERTTLRAA